jgi:rhodanese-related sulfurtransferase
MFPVPRVLVAVLALTAFALPAPLAAACGGSAPAPAAAPTASVPSISQSELVAAITGKTVTVIDLNGTASWRKARIPGAIDAQANAKTLASTLPKDKKALVVVYCGSEQCGAWKQGADFAVAQGYTNVRRFAPGITGWMKAGGKTDRG